MTFISIQLHIVLFKHGTMIPTRIKCKKISCCMRDSACRWLIVENDKIFRSYVKKFLIFPRERNCRIFIDLCKQVFMNNPIMFLDRDNKTKLYPASSFEILELLREKNRFQLNPRAFRFEISKKMPVISLYWFAAQQQTSTLRRQTSGSIYSKFGIE